MVLVNFPKVSKKKKRKITKRSWTDPKGLNQVQPLKKDNNKPVVNPAALYASYSVSHRLPESVT